MQNTPSALNIKRYAELVREKAQKRGAILLGRELTERAAAPATDVGALLLEFERRLAKLKSSAGGGRGDLCTHAFWVSDAKPTPDLPYVVKGIFGKGHIIVFWGAPGSGKTFITMQLACTVGSGALWHGRRTKRYVVIYVLAESTRAYAENRIAALKQEAPDLAKADVLIVPLSLDLLHAEVGDV